VVCGSFRKKLYVLPAVLCLGVLANGISQNRVFSEVQQVFSRELDFVSGNENANILAGRTIMWGRALDTWETLPLMRKIIGDGVGDWGIHNDYMRMLFNGGIIFLGFSILIMAILLFRINLNYAKKHEFIHFAALLGFIYFFVESLGTTPGMYPNLSVVIWGLVGVSMNKNFDWKGAAVAKAAHAQEKL